MLDKNYNAPAIETSIAELWQKADCFKAVDDPAAAENSFSIMLPPPNLTGSLHLGHALDVTIQDILSRFMRMQGKNVLWQPGLDHAGIATQMVVERNLAKEGEKNRHELGREEFVKKVWEWCGKCDSKIVNQMKRLGASCDWSRQRFTLDEGLSKAVNEVFVTLYNQGLIYKDKRLVNWDIVLQTAISDLEVVQQEIKGSLYYINYLLDGCDYNPEDSTSFITIATTRPETLFGDSAIAVNPNDNRFSHLVGKYAIIPLVGRKIPIIADDYVATDTGTGALKVTPAHDFNDFAIGKRHQLRIINVFDAKANLYLSNNLDYEEGLSQEHIKFVAEEFHGVERFKARSNLVKLLENHGYLSKIDKHVHMVPHGDRSGVPIEPFLTDQWYVNAEILAQRAIEVVRSGEIKIIPESWKKTYFQWLENIQPWCISRQLWWGHQIPAWYGPDNHIFVAKSEEEATKQAHDYYGKNVELIRDEDVLDTWFSSGLWPFSTLGWPEQTPALKTFYPTDFLVTGFDIIFFWVSRMIMMGMHLTNEVPFKKVYLHGLVRDKHGAKMSKSKGNVIDPLDLIEEYGADALRFTLASMLTISGRNIRLDPDRIAGYRNFATKLWNATRFAQMNEAIFDDREFVISDVTSDINAWILSELSVTQDNVSHFISESRFNDASVELYKFIWSYFCDWYIELSKPILLSNVEDNKTLRLETRRTMGICLRHIYKMLHPFMPFITEELWQKTNSYDNSSVLASERWEPLNYNNKKATKDINFIINLIKEIRSVRVQMGVPVSLHAPLVIFKAEANILALIDKYISIIKKMGRVEEVKVHSGRPTSSVQLIVSGAIFFIELGNLIDIPKEKARLEKDLVKINLEISKLKAKLSNERFLQNANPEIIENDKGRYEELEASRDKLEGALLHL